METPTNAWAMRFMTGIDKVPTVAKGQLLWPGPLNCIRNEPEQQQQQRNG